MFLICTTLFETHWRISIQRWRYFVCLVWRTCGNQLFPFFIKWHIQFRKYLVGVIICATWLILPMRFSSLSVVILLKLGVHWCTISRMSFFSLSVRIPVESVFGCTIPDRFCIPQVGLLLQACRARGVHLVAAAHRAASVYIWCGQPIRLCFWLAPPSMCHQWWGWWFHK